MMIRVAVCDDELIFCRQISRWLEAEQTRIKKTLEIKTYLSAASLEMDVENGYHIDILFLDIEIGGENGIEVAGRLRNVAPEMLIIYMTAHYDYVYDVFKTRPFEFVRKPFVKDEITKVFGFAVQQVPKEETVTLINNRTIINVKIKDIMYVENQKRKIIIHLKNGKSYEEYATIDEFENKAAKISEWFVRVHKSYFVNYAYIHIYELRKIILWNGTEIAISRKYQSMVREWYINKKCR